MKRIIMIGIGGAIIAAAAIAGTTSFFKPSEGGGFEQLEAWTAVFDQEDAARSHVFDYVAQRSGFRDDGVAVINGEPVTPDNAGIIPYVLQRPLLDPRQDAGAVVLTGFNLAATTTAAMVLDNHPKLLVLLAVPEDAGGQEAFAKAYEARGFATEIIDGVTVRHKGEDGKLDPAMMNMADPFHGESGRSQRVAYVNGTLAGAATWDGIRQGLAGLAQNAECQTCLPWRDMLAGLKSATGNGAYLVQASGWNADAFKVEAPISEAGLSIPLVPLPTFDTVLFAVTEKGSTFSAHLVVRFSDVSDAEAALAEITKRVTAAVTLRGRPETRLKVENGAIQTIGEAGAAVVVLTFASQDAQAAATAISAMAQLVMAQEFLGLAWN